jgi:hypothetical protein
MGICMGSDKLGLTLILFAFELMIMFVELRSYCYLVHGHMVCNNFN